MTNPIMEAAIRGDTDIADIRRVYYDTDRKSHYIEARIKPRYQHSPIAGNTRSSDIAHVWITEREYRALCGLVQLLTRHGDKAWTKAIRVAHLETLTLKFSPTEEYGNDSASLASRLRERFETFVQQDWREPCTEPPALIFDARDWECGFAVLDAEISLFTTARITAKTSSTIGELAGKLDEVTNSSFISTRDIAFNVTWPSGQVELARLDKYQLAELSAVLRLAFKDK